MKLVDLSQRVVNVALLLQPHQRQFMIPRLGLRGHKLLEPCPFPRSSPLPPLRIPSILRRSPTTPFRQFSRGYASGTSSIQVKSKSGRRLRNVGILLSVGVGIWAIDTQFNASALTRTARTFYNGAIIAIDFKMNFNPDNADAIDALHERVAKRMHYVCVTNGGLYIKFAQALAMQAMILPKPYREAFNNVFDMAPHVPFDQVVKVFKAEFGVHPDEAFDQFSREPVASASIAQVHKAKLKSGNKDPRFVSSNIVGSDDDGWVAVKIRKPSVPLQVEYDLMSYRLLLWTYEKLFDLPVSFISKEVTTRMRLEVDLAHEANNAEKTAKFIEGEKSFKGKVVVPKVVWQYTGKSVMTAE